MGIKKVDFANELSNVGQMPKKDYNAGNASIEKVEFNEKIENADLNQNINYYDSSEITQEMLDKGLTDEQLKVYVSEQTTLMDAYIKVFKGLEDEQSKKVDNLKIIYGKISSNNYNPTQMSVQDIEKAKYEALKFYGYDSYEAFYKEYGQATSDLSIMQGLLSNLENNKTNFKDNALFYSKKYKDYAATIVEVNPDDIKFSNKTETIYSNSHQEGTQNVTIASYEEYLKDHPDTNVTSIDFYRAAKKVNPSVRVEMPYNVNLELLSYIADKNPQFVQTFEYILNTDPERAQTYLDNNKDLLNKFEGMKDAEIEIAELAMSDDENIANFVEDFSNVDFKSKDSVKDYLSKIDTLDIDNKEEINKMIKDLDYSDPEQLKIDVSKILDTVDGSRKIEENLANMLNVSVDGLSDGSYDFAEGFAKIFMDGEITAQDYKAMMYMSYLEQHSSYYSTVYQGATSVGNMLPTVTASVLIATFAPEVVPALSAAQATAIGQNVALTLNALSSFGTTQNQLKYEGYEDWEAYLYAGASSLSEVVTEKYLGGILGLSDDASAGLFRNMLNEGREEAIQQVFQSGVLDTLILGKDLDLGELTEETLNSFILGAAMAGVLNSYTGALSFTLNGVKYSFNSSQCAQLAQLLSENHDLSSLDLSTISGDMGNGEYQSIDNTNSSQDSSRNGNETVIIDEIKLTQEQQRVIDEMKKFDFSNFFHNEGASNAAVGLITPSQSIYTDTFVKKGNARGEHGDAIGAIYDAIYDNSQGVRPQTMDLSWQEIANGDGNIVIQFCAPNTASNLFWLPNNVTDFQLEQLEALNEKIKRISSQDADFFKDNPLLFEALYRGEVIDCGENLDEIINKIKSSSNKTSEIDDENIDSVKDGTQGSSEVIGLGDLVPDGINDFSVDYLEKVFADDKLFNAIVIGEANNYYYGSHDLSYIESYHDLYNKVVSENINVDSNILERLKTANDLYERLSADKQKYDSMRTNSKILSPEEVANSLNERLSNMMSVDQIPANESHADVIRQVSQDMGTFSLDTIFNPEYAEQYSESDLNGATIITPSQTLSRLNGANDARGGMLGSGLHNDNFRDMVNSVYGQDFGDEGITGQDIRIRYASKYRPDGQVLEMTINIPLPINSTQLESLQKLNEDIKAYSAEHGVNFTIAASIDDFNNPSSGLDYQIVEDFSDQENLDRILNSVIVNDEFEPTYNEKYKIGVSNSEASYNDSNYVLSDDFSSLVINSIGLQDLVPDGIGDVSLSNLEYIFGNDKAFDGFLLDLTSIDELRPYHDLYNYIVNNNTVVDENITNRLRTLDDVYKNYFDSLNSENGHKINLIVAAFEDSSHKLSIGEALNQIDKYLKTGDPLLITSNEGARDLIQAMSHEDIESGLQYFNELIHNIQNPEAIAFDKMYSEALKENQEFDIQQVRKYENLDKVRRLIEANIMGVGYDEKTAIKSINEYIEKNDETFITRKFGARDLLKTMSLDDVKEGLELFVSEKDQREASEIQKINDNRPVLEANLQDLKQNFKNIVIDGNNYSRWNVFKISSKEATKVSKDPQNYELGKELLEKMMDSITVENVEAQRFMQKLIDLKSKHPEFAVLCIPEFDKNYHLEGRVYLSADLLDSDNFNTISHEIGHAMHYYYNDMEAFDLWDQYMQQINSTPGISQKVRDFVEGMERTFDNLENKALDDFNNSSEFDYAQLYAEEMADLHEAGSIDKYLLDLGMSRKEINNFKKLLNINYGFFGRGAEANFEADSQKVVSEIVKQMRHEELYYLVDQYLRNNDVHSGILSDIISTIFGGMQSDGTVKLPDGTEVSVMYGHNTDYYDLEPNKKFEEIFANFVSLKVNAKTDDLNVLKNIIGEDAFNFLNDFYNDVMS